MSSPIIRSYWRLFAIQLNVQIRNGCSQLFLLLIQQLLHLFIDTEGKRQHLLVEVEGQTLGNFIKETLIPICLLHVPFVGLVVEVDEFGLAYFSLE